MSNITTIPVYFDSNGVAVHFGEWVDWYTSDREGNKVLLNPLPSDFVRKDTEVETLLDGLRVVVNK
jgi:hypothetical protein